jgi:hypothetical protein
MKRFVSGTTTAAKTRCSARENFGINETDVTRHVCG